MTKEELADALNRLDPGARLDVNKEALDQIFPSPDALDEVHPEIEAFAEAHMCTFAPAVAGMDGPAFVKNDVF